MIGVGIFWASAVGMPYLMVASMVPAKRTGVYMGILNMMIVVPMLIQTVTFGWIFSNLLDSKGSNAMTARRRPDGHRRRGDAVGEPARRGGRVADRPARRASAASPCTTGWWSVRTAPRPACTPWTGPRRWRRPPRPGWSSSRRTATTTPARLRAPPRECTATSTVSRLLAKPWRSRSPALTKERARYIEQRLVRGGPAQALLDTVGANPANLIVVGNRGLGAQRGTAAGIGARRRREERRLRRARRADVGAGRGPPVPPTARRSCRRRRSLVALLEADRLAQLLRWPPRAPGRCASGTPSARPAPSASTFSFSWEASSVRRPAFSSSTSSRMDSTLATVWIATCHCFRSGHSGALTSQTSTIARQSRKNGARLTRPWTASTNFSNALRPSSCLRS